MDARKNRLLELLLVHAFQYREDPPFLLASGRSSPYYVDCKPVTLHPEGMHLIGGLGYEALRDTGVTAVGGLTLGADPIANAIAMHSFHRSRQLKSFVVRKEAKDHGTGRWLEGAVSPGERVAVIEDVATTGGSARTAIARIRAAGLVVEHALVLVDREEGGCEAIAADGVEVHVLVRRSELMALRAAAERHARDG
jgi:orotate phosphoribosyltransferase